MNLVFHSNVSGDVKVEDKRSDSPKPFEGHQKDSCQSKGNNEHCEDSLRRMDPGEQKLEETAGSTHSNPEVTHGQTSPKSSDGDSAVIEMKHDTEVTALAFNSPDANLSKVATEKTKMELSLSQNLSADVEMLSPESPISKSLLCNSSGERHSPCTESQAPCAESSSSVDSTNIIDIRDGSGTGRDPDVTAMDTDSTDMPVPDSDSVMANEDSSGNQSQIRYTHTHTCSNVFSCLQMIVGLFDVVFFCFLFSEPVLVTRPHFDRKWLGTPIEELSTMAAYAQQLPPLKATDYNKVLIRVSSLHWF